MSKIAESLATFWTAESAVFTTEGGTMVANQANMPRPILNNVMKTRSIENWTTIKEVFQNYSVVLDRIIGLYNTSTAAQPLATSQYTVDELDIELTVPSSVDVARIMAD